LDISLLKEKSLMDLREIAKLAGITSVTKYRKGELLDMLYNMDKQAKQEQQATQQPDVAEAELSEEDSIIPVYQQDVINKRKIRPSKEDAAKVLSFVNALAAKKGTTH